MTELNKAVHLNYGSFTIFLNSTFSRDDIPKELKSLFQLLEDDTVAENEPWLANLQNAVKSMENEKEVRSKMTLYDEWVRTATALEKYKKKLEDSEQARQQAEDDKRLLESLTKDVYKRQAWGKHSAKKLPYLFTNLQGAMYSF